jgi:hypothetical protein
VINDPGGREKLLALGTRALPVVARGDQYVNAQNLELVAKFLGLSGTGHTLLPPDVLFLKMGRIQRAAQRYMRQIPNDKMTLSATHNRDRPIRQLCHHIFCIGEAHLECAVNGRTYENSLTSKKLEDGTYTTGDEIARYGDTIIARIEDWWNGLADRTLQQQIETFYGPISLHHLLERSTWHPAQHARQLMAVLEGFGIEPDGRLTAEDLAGLPLPERLWE